MYGKDGKFSIDSKDIAPDPDPAESVLDEIVRRAGLAAAQTREALFWRMIADGQFPSQGWRIAERTTFDGREFKYECWPLPPAKRSEDGKASQP